MGDRRVCEIKTEAGDIFFYSHWHGKTLPDIAYDAMREAQVRKGDEPYVLRIILDYMIKHTDSRDSEAGSGISLSRDEQQDEYIDGYTPSIIMDLRNWTLSSQDSGTSETEPEVTSYQVDLWRLNLKQEVK